MTLHCSFCNCAVAKPPTAATPPKSVKGFILRINSHHHHRPKANKERYCSYFLHYTRPWDWDEDQLYSGVGVHWRGQSSHSAVLPFVGSNVVHFFVDVIWEWISWNPTNKPKTFPSDWNVFLYISETTSRSNILVEKKFFFIKQIKLTRIISAFVWQ